jgi:thiol-disulfide isomerase/thioredoxin
MATASSRAGILFRFLLPFGALLALVFGTLLIVKSRVPSGTAHGAFGVGATTPDFRLHPFPRGKAVQVSSLGAKVLLLNFWATWCDACLQEMPSLVRLRGQFHGQGLEVLPINMDENPEPVLPRALRAFQIDFPAYVDEEAALSELFDVRAIPFTVVLDRNRKILYVESLARDWTAGPILEKVRAWLAG